MAFRIVTYKEHYEDNGGMRLTYPTLGAMLKYPWTSHFANSEHEEHKFSCFKTEYDNLCEVAQELKLVEKTRDQSQSKAKYARHPLAYLVEAADDICYRVLDMEDAIEMKLLPQDVFDQEFKKQYLLCELSNEQQRLLDDDSISWSIKNGLLRGKIIGLMIKEIVEAFKKNYDRIMEGSLGSDLISKTDTNSLCLGIKALYKKDNLKKKIYQNQRNVPLELGAYGALQTLLGASTKAASEIYKDEGISYKTEIIKKFIKQDGEKRFKDKTLHGIIMLFLDYVTGMTDDFATYMNRQLLGLGN
jgi:dGTPase